ncbi:MAG TPA: DUF2179 domain-containing protein [Syntrophomonadaceae bacterium]|jgi:uncharacterized protein YebE (UPF0316 family)|nr:DUF2179 domain-containing protein [Syntrophomonadaceae bacterium]
MYLQLLFIFMARIIDVSLGTIRMILIIRGDKWTAAIIGFVEIMVYTVALGMVVGSLNDPVKLIIFCLGFSLGVVVGSLIEERLALGYRGVQVIVDCEHACIAEELREQGFPVTTWEAHGRVGPKVVLNTVVKRQLARKLAAYVTERDPGAFVVFMEPKHFRGGYMKKK